MNHKDYYRFPQGVSDMAFYGISVDLRGRLFSTFFAAAVDEYLIGVNLPFEFGFLEHAAPVHAVALVDGESFVFGFDGFKIEIYPCFPGIQCGEGLLIHLMGVIFGFLHNAVIIS